VTTSTPNSQQDAKDTLDYIRRTMESASTYTAVSGWGLVVSGAVGLLATWLAWMRGVPADLQIWIPAAIISVAAASVANALKARQIDVPVWSGVLRRVFWVVVPVLVAGALLTFALETNDVLRTRYPLDGSRLPCARCCCPGPTRPRPGDAGRRFRRTSHRSRAGHYMETWWVTSFRTTSIA